MAAEGKRLDLNCLSQCSCSFSPDDRYLAYVSDESGRSEVYVRAVTGEGGKWQISLDGGTAPVWAPNGREIFFRNGNAVLSTDISFIPQIRVGRSRVLFTGNYAPATSRE